MKLLHLKIRKHLIKQMFPKNMKSGKSLFTQIPGTCYFHWTFAYLFLMSVCKFCAPFIFIIKSKGWNRSVQFRILLLKFGGNLVLKRVRRPQSARKKIQEMTECCWEKKSWTSLKRNIIIFSFIGNEIAEVKGLDPTKLSRLTTLELRSNKLTTTAGISLPSLKKIYLGENAITQIEDLARLEHLTILHLRQNDINKLDGFSENMKQLQYLNLRSVLKPDF